MKKSRKKHAGVLVLSGLAASAFLALVQWQLKALPTLRSDTLYNPLPIPDEQYRHSLEEQLATARTELQRCRRAVQKNAATLKN